MRLEHVARAIGAAPHVGARRAGIAERQHHGVDPVRGDEVGEAGLAVADVTTILLLAQLAGGDRHLRIRGAQANVVAVVPVGAQRAVVDDLAAVRAAEDEVDARAGQVQIVGLVGQLTGEHHDRVGASGRGLDGGGRVAALAVAHGCPARPR